MSIMVDQETEVKEFAHKSLGEIVDDLSDSYFARGCDAFTANLCALRDVQLILVQSVDILSSLLSKFGNAPAVPVDE